MTIFSLFFKIWSNLVTDLREMRQEEYNYIMQLDQSLSDTSPEAEVVLLNLLRQAPAWRKFKMVGDLNAAVRLLAIEGIRERHPEATEQEIERHLADLLLGAALAKEVFGPWESTNAA